MARHGVRTKIYKALLLSVRGTKSINHHQVALEEWAKGVVEGGPAEKMGSELQVCWAKKTMNKIEGISWVLGATAARDTMWMKATRQMGQEEI
jgi:hypothetical protein